MDWTNETLTPSQQTGDLIITKKDAAKEFYKVHKTMTGLCVMSIVATLVIIAVPKRIALLIALVPVGFSAFYLQRSVKRMNDLNEKYALGYKKVEFKVENTKARGKKA